MDTYEATRIVLSRIKNLDPENSSKIMGYILMQVQGEQEMIRLALCPDTHLLSLINQAKAALGLLSRNPTRPAAYAAVLNSSASGYSSSSHLCSKTDDLAQENQFPVMGFSGNDDLLRGSVENGSGWGAYGRAAVLNSSASGYSSSPHLCSKTDDLTQENQFPVMGFSGNDDLLRGSVENWSGWGPYDRASVLDSSASGYSSSPHLCSKTDDLAQENQFPVLGCSRNDDSSCGSVISGSRWGPYDRGFCKGGGSCNFLHGRDDSPGNPDEFLRIKALLQQQRLARALQLGASGVHYPLAPNKCLNLFNGDQRFGRCQPERDDFSTLTSGGYPDVSERQIYLTFPADSSFNEADVSKYFSMYGPVQDVRIPYQQKRMFGFVSFVFPETVKLILSKGNPHFVCDSRVLVKPYKEKGKDPEKKLQRHNMERREFSPCLSPSGVDSTEAYDLAFGARRKLEERIQLQHAIELQQRRLMRFRLMNLPSSVTNHQYRPSLSSVVSTPSPIHCRAQVSDVLVIPTDGDNQQCTKREEIITSREAASSSSVTVGENMPLEGTESSNSSHGDGSRNEEQFMKVENSNNFGRLSSKQDAIEL